ncbi:MAG: HAD hydrolase-like protein [Acidobacteria bacterium]|nr:HAD hydrolase-like protein [Acidobacteriota bacterium]
MNRCLIFDADDTLWENNIYFERAIQEFLELMKLVSPDAAPIRDTLRQVEKELIPVGGYGSRNFIYALKETYCRLHNRKDGAAYLRGIERIGERLLNHPLDLRPGVSATLPLLAQHYRVMLFSKGDPREQSGKLQRSGLRQYFSRVIIVPEKDTPAYHTLLREHGLAPEKSFMIGNSPRSDVVPALAAGLWAVYMPHPNTWDYEEHPVEPHPRLLRANSFEELPAVLTQQHLADTTPSPV